ncbi:MAG: MFS transporter [Campylobacterales bacterium]
MNLKTTAYFLGAFYFFFFAHVGVVMIYMPKVLYDLGYSAFDIGVLYSIIPITRFIVPFFFVKNELNRAVFLSSLLAFSLASFILLFTIKSFFLFGLNLFIIGVCIAIMPPYIETIAIGLLKKERYGRVRLFGSIGFALVALVLSYFVDNYISVVLFLAIFVTISAILAYYISLANVTHGITTEDPKSGFRFRDEIGLWINIFLLQLSFGAFYGFFTIYETELGFSVEMVSYFWIFGVVCEIAMLYFQTTLMKRFSLMALIKFSSFATAIRWLMLYAYGDDMVMVFISQSFHALSFALFHSAVISYLFAHYEKKKLAQQFYYGIAYGLGMFAGSIFAGAIYGEYIFLIAAGIAFLSFLALYIKPKRLAKDVPSVEKSKNT